MRVVGLMRVTKSTKGASERRRLGCDPFAMIACFLCLGRIIPRQQIMSGLQSVVATPEPLRNTTPNARTSDSTLASYSVRLCSRGGPCLMKGFWTVAATAYFCQYFTQ